MCLNFFLGPKRRSRKTRLVNGEPPPEPSTANDNPGNPDTSAASDTLDLSDLDLSKMELSEKEVEALSGLTPALSRRLQQQLLAHLPPAAARSLRRTLSAHLPPSSHPILPYTRSLSATKQADSDTPTPTPEMSKCEPEIGTKSNADYSPPSFSDSVSIQLPPSSHTTLPHTRSLTTNQQMDSATPTPEISKRESEIDTNSYAVPSSSQATLRYTGSPGSNTPAPAISNFTPEIEVNSYADYSSSPFSDLMSLKNAKSWHSIDNSSPISESITPKAPSVGRYTPDGSCLSKYLSTGEEYPSSLRSYEHGGLERDSGYTAGGSALSNIPMGGSLRRRSLRTPPADTSHRRVSRFLRPDFFDTPREESLYVRDKKEKELETQKILKEIRQKKSRHSDLPSPNSPVAPTDVTDMLSARSGYRNSLSPVGIPVPKDKSRSVTPFHPILDNISEYHSDPITAKDELVAVDNKLENSSHKCQTDKSSVSQIQSPIQNIYPSVNTDRGSFKFNNKESRLVRPKSFPTKSYEEDGYNATERNVGKKDACSNIPTNSFTSKDSKLTRPKSYPNSSQSPEKAFSVPPVTENSNLKQVNNTNYSDMAKPVPLQNGSSENEQNVTVSFSVCLPSRNSNKHVLKTESSSKELSIKKYVVVKADAELKKEATISNNAINSASIECKDSMKIPLKSVSGLSSESELLLKPDKANFKVSDVESTLKSGVLNPGIQLENNSLSKYNSVHRISPEKRVTDIANNMKPKVLDSDINLEQSVLPGNSVDKVTAPNQILEITSIKPDVVTADSHLDNNSLSKNIIGSTPIAFTSGNKVEENANLLIKSDLEEKTENPCPEEKKKKTLGKKKIIIKKKVVKKTDSTLDASNNTSTLIRDKPPKNEEEKLVPVKKKSVLHSIGEKIEKFRNDSFNRSASQEKDSASEAKSKPQLAIPKDEVKPSRIENVMRALRERSVPSGDLVEPITESGLIKRAVTVTDLPTLDTKLSTSKKSVNRVLGLFKKIESKDKSTKTVLEKSGNDLVKVEVDPLPIELPKCSDNQLPDNNKPKRPTSLLLNGIGKRVQACYNGASSDSVLTKEIKSTSKPENFNSNFDGELKSQKKGLRLDFSRLPKLNQGIFNKRNSLDLSKSREGSQSKEIESNNEWQSQSYHKTREGSQSKEVERNHRCQSLTTYQNPEMCQTKNVDSGNEWQGQSSHKTREGSQSKKEAERNQRCQSLTIGPNPERCQSIEVESSNEWQSQCLTTHQNPERCHSKEVASNNDWQSQSYHRTGERGQTGVESNRQLPAESNNLQWQSQSSLKSQESREVANGSWENQNSQQNYDPALDTFSNGGTKANECSNNNYSPANNTLISPNWSPDCDTSKFMIEPDADYNQNSSQPAQRSYEATSPDSENIIDRIRRKSFYNRFNEKKNRRKSQLVGPGAKEYIPSERIHPQADGDSSYHSKYDYTPSSTKYERPQTLELAKLSDNGGSSSPTKYRGSNSFGTDHLSPTSHKSLDRHERRYLLEPQYQPYSENNLHYSMPRYSRTVSLLDSNDGYQPATEYKNTSSRYGRSFSLLSPTNYSTLSPRAPPRNSAILLRDSGDVEPTTESVLTKIRNRKKLAAMSPTTDDEESYLDKKIRYVRY